MKKNYFTKVENKYVFNLSLIFWHLFIALSTVAIVVCMLVFLWSIIPPSQKNIEKQPYPEKKHYPATVKVTLNELNLGEIKQEEPPPVAPNPVYTSSTNTSMPQQPIEDTKGKKEYENSLNILKSLIPPSKYSWQGTGYWTYPSGERFWTFYKQEKYRQWIVTESGIEDKLKYSYKTTKANNYIEKKQILDGYISIIKLLPEKKRSEALLYLINNIADNISQNSNIYQSLAKVVNKMAKEENILYIDQLASFGKINPNDGSLFIDYTASIIDNFDATQRTIIIDRLKNSYYTYFNQKFSKQKEATNLFIPLVAQIKAVLQPKAIMEYYQIYLSKNYERDNVISQIENEYQQAMNEIDKQYNLEQEKAQIEYQANKEAKQEYRYKSLFGIAGGIILIVLIATILVFLSIQRSVRKIEEKILIQDNSQVQAGSDL